MQSNNKKIDSKSEQITKEIKNAVFKRIFEIVNTNNDQKIYGKQINIGLIPDGLRGIVEPLLSELSEQDESLTLEEFLMACDHLYEVCTLFLLKL